MPTRIYNEHDALHQVLDAQGKVIAESIDVQGLTAPPQDWKWRLQDHARKESAYYSIGELDQLMEKLAHHVGHPGRITLTTRGDAEPSESPRNGAENEAAQGPASAAAPFCGGLRIVHGTISGDTPAEGKSGTPHGAKFPAE